MHDSTRPRPCLRRLLAALAFAGLAGLASAGPVTAAADSNAEPDPYELALRWTLASVGPGIGTPAQLPPPAPRADPPLRLPLGAVGAIEGGVPDPGAYALMGLVLVGVGLLARHLTRTQRGFSKKT